jgi:hypothetical protein
MSADFEYAVYHIKYHTSTPGRSLTASNSEDSSKEGGAAPLGPLSLVAPGDNEMRRESDRQGRFHRMKAVVEMVLREIDECGIMRKPSWDGVRALLLMPSLGSPRRQPHRSGQHAPLLVGIVARIPRRTRQLRKHLPNCGL